MCYGALEGCEKLVGQRYVSPQYRVSRVSHAHDRQTKASNRRLPTLENCSKDALSPELHAPGSAQFKKRFIPSLSLALVVLPGLRARGASSPLSVSPLLFLTHCYANAYLCFYTCLSVCIRMRYV